MKSIKDLSEQERNAIADFRRQVGEAFPGVSTRLTLFGSRARGNGDVESDLDLLLELDLEWVSFADNRILIRFAGDVSLEDGLVLSVSTVDRATARECRDDSVLVNSKEHSLCAKKKARDCRPRPGEV